MELTFTPGRLLLRAPYLHLEVTHGSIGVHHEHFLHHRRRSRRRRSCWLLRTARLNKQLDGLSEYNECRFGTIALVTLERAQIDTGGVRLDAGEHHLAPHRWHFGRSMV